MHQGDFLVIETVNEKSPPCVYQTLAGKSLLIMGATARQCPFCIFILSFVRICVKKRCHINCIRKALRSLRGKCNAFFVPNTNLDKAARSITCVGTLMNFSQQLLAVSFNAARSITCVGTSDASGAPERMKGFNAARSITCVGTLSSPALVPRGLRSHFGKSSVFRAVFAAEMRSPDGKSRGRSSLFLVRHGLRRFGKLQRWNAACALLWIIFHFSLR